MTPASGPAPGAAVDRQVGVRFSVWAPAARRVAVERVGAGSRTDLERLERGLFSGVDPRAAAGDDYFFRLDDGPPLPDPASRHQPEGVTGPSRVVDPRAFAWSDSHWAGVERADLVLYELHVGTFSEAGSFDAASEHFAGLCELGITALELMPVAEFPGERNWGYDGVFPYAPHSRYGGPEGLQRLVDAAHAAGLAVVLDVVYNHLGPEGNVFAHFGPYFTDRYRTPWGGAINFDGPNSDGVRRFFLENALAWLRDFHIDGLRLDAVHSIHDESAQPFLAELAQAVRALERTRGVPLHLIAESDANDPRLLHPPERGGLGLDAVWSDDFHHAVHAQLTQERHGYYADFGGVSRVAKALAARFVYDGDWSEHRQRRHGAPASDLPSERFVVCVQNHDQVGNRAQGERLCSILSPRRQRLASSLLLLSPYLPLLFMGEEYGETRPFLYFVSHRDPELIEAVRRGRRGEFELEGELPDPADPETFARSRLDRRAAQSRSGACRLELHRALLRLRRTEPALRPGAARLAVECEPDRGWIRVDYRLQEQLAAFAVFHFGQETLEVLAPAREGGWRLRFHSENGEFGGDAKLPERLAPTPDPLPAHPESALLYVAASA